MRLYITALITLMVGILWNATDLSGQRGIIQGVIHDERTGEEIIGASVYLESITGTGTSTDFEGRFYLSGIPEGTYTLVVSYIGYKTLKIEEVAVQAGRSTNMELKLSEDIEQLGEITVVGVRSTNTEIAVILDIRQAEQIVSGISAQEISRTLDGDALQVARRVPGINIGANNFIQIRGLGARYNNVMLHNSFAPSMETDVRSFAFDVIPSNQLDRMMIYKSPAAELPGEFSGGLVKIHTRSIPEENSLVFSYGTQYRQGTTFEPFKYQQRSSTYLTGINDGFYDLPDGFPSDLRRLNLAQLEEAGKSLRNLWREETGIAAPGQSFSLGGSFRKGLKNGWRIGHVSHASYNFSNSIYDVIRRDYNAFDETINGSQMIYDFNDRQYNHTIKLGLIHNWAVRLNGNNLIEFKNLFNQNAIGQYVNRTGRNFESNVYLNNGAFDQVYRGIYSGQLLGTHTLPSEAGQLDWVIGYNRTYRNQPDYKRYRSDVDESTGSRTLYVPPGAAAAEFLGRFFSRMDESSLMASADYTRKLGENRGRRFIPVLKAGILGDYKTRTFQARNIGFIRNSIDQFDMELLDLTIGELFEPHNINSTTGVRIDEQSNPSDNYEAINTLAAAYASINLPISSRFRLIAGLRGEYNIQQLESATVTNIPVTVDNPQLSVLPSANLTYDLNEISLLRAAYGMTINRPEFRELAPFGFYDFSFNLTNRGNPLLETPNIHNFDLRYELYPGRGEMISLAVFYKYFDRPIETIFVPGAGSLGAKTFTYGNATSASSYGLEVELRKDLGFLGGRLFNDLSMVFNAALIQSDITIGEEFYGQSDFRPLQGQANYIINGGLFYYNQRSGLQVNAVYNVVGKRILIVGTEDYADIYEMPRHIIDLSISKQIGERWMIRAGISDLLNMEVLLLQDSNQDGIFDKEVDNIMQQYRPGSVFSLGLNYKIF